MVAYYAQRADAGLIISEGTIVSPQGRGYFEYDGQPPVAPSAVNPEWKMFSLTGQPDAVTPQALSREGKSPVSSPTLPRPPPIAMAAG